MLAQRSTPIKLSQEAAVKLPRAGFWLLLAVFALSGFFADDLWTPRDIDSFAAAWSLTQAPLEAWLLPSAFGESLTNAGPLTAWVSALLMRLLGEQGLSWLSEVEVLRLAALIWFTLSAFALWEAAYRLARRPEAQPIAFAFGGEARPKDFARSIADSTVLLFVAIFGILTRQHEAVPDTALLAIAALNLYALTIAIKRPILGSVMAGLSVCASIVASTLFAGVWLLAQSLIVVGTLSNGSRERDISFIALILSATALFSLWPLSAWVVNAQATSLWFHQWALAQTDHFGPAGLSTYLWFAKHSLWFLLPVWPLVLMGLLSWGRRLTETFLFLPTVVIAITALGVIFSSRQSTDSVFLACLPALTVFAAFSLLTIRRGWESVLDWFGLTIFSLAALTIWLYWGAWFSGMPPKMHQSIIHLAPTVRPSFDGGFVVACAVSVAWIALLVWRLTHRSVALWRGPWINAVGMTVTVVIGLGLFHHAATEFRSLAPVVGTIEKLLIADGFQPGDCITPVRLSPAQSTVMTYYGQGPLTQLKASGSCRFTLIRQSSSAPTLELAGAVGAARTRSGEAFYVIQSARLPQGAPITETLLHK